MREVYPFTRTNNIKLHSDLLRKLYKIKTNSGLIILEQIEDQKSIFQNLNKLQYKYEIKIVIPNRLLKNNLYKKIEKYLNIFTQFLIKVLEISKLYKFRYYIIFK